VSVLFVVKLVNAFYLFASEADRTAFSSVVTLDFIWLYKVYLYTKVLNLRKSLDVDAGASGSDSVQKLRTHKKLSSQDFLDK
jgi:hypothetical protein